MDRIYLDHAATTPLRPEARAAMEPWLGEAFGNPSSLYLEGRRAREAVDEAREAISRLLGCDFGEITFTSSGTEAANLALFGAALARRDGPRRRVLFGAAEHHAVLETEETLTALGYEVGRVKVDRHAVLDLDDLAAMLGDDVLLVALMHANNELGTFQPVREAGEMAKAAGALFFCDVVQTFGAMDWTVDEIGADLAAISAHKTYGPKGVGALFIRAGTKVKPWTVGGGQEREMRAGTENVAGIVGFAAAAAATVAGCHESKHNKSLAREAFFAELANVSTPTHPRPIRTVPVEIPTLPGHAHLRFPGLSAESMLIVLDRLGVAASSAAACSSGSLEPSHVLLAASYSEAEAKEGLRFTFGRSSTVERAEAAARRVLQAAEQVRFGVR